MTGVYAVALMDRRESPLRNSASLLSVRERMETDTYRHPVRREKALTSRLLCKYLVAHPAPPEFHYVAAKEITYADSSRWTGIELLSGPAKKRVAATVVHAGNAVSDLSVSSSHCGEYTASCISSHCIGLDLERIEPRRAEFYAGSFSAEEQAWAKRACSVGSDGIEAAFAFLWTVKEAYLKSCPRPDLSIWSFPNWTVRVDTAVNNALQSKPHEKLTRFHGGMQAPNFSATFEISTMRIYNMVLTTVSYQKSSTLDAPGSAR